MSALTRPAAEAFVLSAAFHNGCQMWDMVDPSELDEGFRQVAQAMAALTDRGKTVDIESLTAECARRGVTPNVDRWMMYPIPCEEAFRMYVDATARTRIEQTVLRAAQHLDSGVDHWDVADEVTSTIEGLQRPVQSREKYWHDWADVIEMSQDEPVWTLPGLLARQERCVITGMEGHGKSTLIYQLILGAAFGVSPLDPEVTFPPQKVLILDVENVIETQIASQYRTMQVAYRRRTADGFTSPDVRLLGNRMIDLTRPGDRKYMIDAAAEYQPDLLYMGSGYRLADGTQDYRVVANSIQQTVDQIRADVGCSTILETHSGHGFQNDRNGWRPDGSSYWVRWPEFGLGLEPVPSKQKRRVLRLVKWRGDRVTGRAWPDGFLSGGQMPWVPAEEAEIELAM